MPSSRGSRRAPPAPPRRRRPGLTLLALGLLGLFAVALGWRGIAAGLNIVRGAMYNRPAPAQVALRPEKPDSLLQTRITDAARVSAGTVGVVITDLRTGATATIEPDRRFGAASLFKLPILVEVLRQQRIGRLNPDQKLRIEQKHWTDGSGVLQARVGDELPVRELTRLMIQESDNIAALVLLDAVGENSVNETASAMGLKSTKVVEGGGHTTSPRDMALLMEIIAGGQLVDAATSEEALKFLELKQANSWLSERLPWWVKAPHKWGDLPPLRHDAGIVYTPDSTFAAVVLTEGVPANEAKKVIGDISAAAFSYFND